MGSQRVHNWFGDITSSPCVVTYPRSIEDLVAIMRDPDAYPPPVRAVGSNHSVTACGTAEGGTLVVMRHLNRILRIGADTVTAEAGALYIDVARELQERGLQFYVNLELGNVSIGSAACAGTKDASMPGEFGHGNSYAVGMKMVTPAGEVVEVTDAQPDVLQMMRSSYGLFGIVYEATFRVKPLQALDVHHESYSVDEFARQLPALKARGDSIMYYFSPFLETVTVEFRRYHAQRRPASTRQWWLRNVAWRDVAGFYCHLASTYVPQKSLRYLLIDSFNRAIIGVLVALIRGQDTSPTDQLIRFPDKATSSKYTFSIWAFPEETFVDTLHAYVKFCQDYYRSHGYRANMMNVGYRISKDTSSLFSSSFHGDVMTLDPISTGDRGWEEFVAAYNDFCMRHDGVPLFNQSPLLTRAQVEHAFGDRLARFEEQRRRFDPTDRLLNPYFKALLS